MPTPTEQKQVKMHADFFDRTKQAIDDGFYLEAMFREYAAIEGRLESLLSILGAPCNKELPYQHRKNINISHRVTCLSRYYKNCELLGSTKLTAEYFMALDKWIKNRNIYIHGLYKNELAYDERCQECCALAVEGFRYARMLYNEAKRLRKYLNNHPEIPLTSEGICRSRGCCAKSER